MIIMTEIMADAIRDLEGVTFVNIITNGSYEYNHVTQMPAKSIRVLVKGGKKKQIAKIISRHNMVGILTVGNTKVKIEDSLGFTRTIRFEAIQ